MQENRRLRFRHQVWMTDPLIRSVSLTHRGLLLSILDGYDGSLNPFPFIDLDGNPSSYDVHADESTPATRVLELLSDLRRARIINSFTDDAVEMNSEILNRLFWVA